MTLINVQTMYISTSSVNQCIVSELAYAQEFNYQSDQLAHLAQKGFLLGSLFVNKFNSVLLRSNMDHYAVYETNHLLRHNFISLLSSSPQVNLHRFRMKLRNDREVYYVFNEDNCAHIHDFLNNRIRIIFSNVLFGLNKKLLSIKCHTLLIPTRY